MKLKNYLKKIFSIFSYINKSYFYLTERKIRDIVLKSKSDFKNFWIFIDYNEDDASTNSLHNVSYDIFQSKFIGIILSCITYPNHIFYMWDYVDLEIDGGIEEDVKVHDLMDMHLPMNLLNEDRMVLRKIQYIEETIKNNYHKYYIDLKKPIIEYTYEEDMQEQSLDKKLTSIELRELFKFDTHFFANSTLLNYKIPTLRFRSFVFFLLNKHIFDKIYKYHEREIDLYSRWLCIFYKNTSWNYIILHENSKDSLTFFMWIYWYSNALYYKNKLRTVKDWRGVHHDVYDFDSEEDEFYEEDEDEEMAAEGEAGSICRLVYLKRNNSPITQRTIDESRMDALEPVGLFSDILEHIFYAFFCDEFLCDNNDYDSLNIDNHIFPQIANQFKFKKYNMIFKKEKEIEYEYTLLKKYRKFMHKNINRIYKKNKILINIFLLYLNTVPEEIIISKIRNIVEAIHQYEIIYNIRNVRTKQGFSLDQIQQEKDFRFLELYEKYNYKSRYKHLILKEIETEIKRTNIKKVSYDIFYNLLDAFFTNDFSKYVQIIELYNLPINKHKLDIKHIENIEKQIIYKNANYIKDEYIYLYENYFEIYNKIKYYYIKEPVTLKEIDKEYHIYDIVEKNENITNTTIFLINLKLTILKIIRYYKIVKQFFILKKKKKNYKFQFKNKKQFFILKKYFVLFFMRFYFKFKQQPVKEYRQFLRIFSKNNNIFNLYKNYEKRYKRHFLLLLFLKNIIEFVLFFNIILKKFIIRLKKSPYFIIKIIKYNLLYQMLNIKYKKMCVLAYFCDRLEPFLTRIILSIHNNKNIFFHIFKNMNIFIHNDRLWNIYKLILIKNYNLQEKINKLNNIFKSDDKYIKDSFDRNKHKLVYKFVTDIREDFENTKNNMLFFDSDIYLNKNTFGNLNTYYYKIQNTTKKYDFILKYLFIIPSRIIIKNLIDINIHIKALNRYNYIQLPQYFFMIKKTNKSDYNYNFNNIFLYSNKNLNNQYNFNQKFHNIFESSVYFSNILYYDSQINFINVELIDIINLYNTIVHKKLLISNNNQLLSSSINENLIFKYFPKLLPIIPNDIFILAAIKIAFNIKKLQFDKYIITDKSIRYLDRIEIRIDKFPNTFFHKNVFPLIGLSKSNSYYSTEEVFARIINSNYHIGINRRNSLTDTFIFFIKRFFIFSKQFFIDYVFDIILRVTKIRLAIQYLEYAFYGSMVQLIVGEDIQLDVEDLNNNYEIVTDLLDDTLNYLAYNYYFIEFIFTILPNFIDRLKYDFILFHLFWFPFIIMPSIIFEGILILFLKVRIKLLKIHLKYSNAIFIGIMLFIRWCILMFIWFQIAIHTIVIPIAIGKFFTQYDLRGGVWPHFEHRIFNIFFEIGTIFRGMPLEFYNYYTYCSLIYLFALLIFFTSLLIFQSLRELIWYEMYTILMSILLFYFLMFYFPVDSQVYIWSWQYWDYGIRFYQIIEYEEEDFDIMDDKLYDFFTRIIQLFE